MKFLRRTFQHVMISRVSPAGICSRQSKIMQWLYKSYLNAISFSAPRRGQMVLAMKATAHLEYYLGATQGEQDGEIDLVNFDPPLLEYSIGYCQ